ncbi:VPLPA-CTERM sorting domain-containing protein [Marimonas arenosa]|uniref:VPLPA-CTERM sorting domain-containing protein n=1 Tax=Marimonas arenosa TaxID=1795305 RepID=A0AAE4B7D5_9RHOB|nr:VPLPA-CTERM sorting domain-containing protein [Marimonas arenosa]MDQ2091371.1 VPLPA-CTERM sorting domain-containing protein [Marimonas arenosa]
MKKFFALCLGFVSLLAVSATETKAVTLNVVGGQLLGVSGLDVDGTLYDVEFVDGTCAALFSGCDEQSDFALNAGNILAALAALDSLFDNNPVFDDIPGNVSGCGSLARCFVVSPYAPMSGFDRSLTGNLQNDQVEANDQFYLTNYDIFQDFGGPNNSLVYAVWSVAEVPLPASMPILVAGLGGLVLIRRRRKAS